MYYNILCAGAKLQWSRVSWEGLHSGRCEVRLHWSQQLCAGSNWPMEMCVSQVISGQQNFIHKETFEIHAYTFLIMCVFDLK